MWWEALILFIWYFCYVGFMKWNEPAEDALRKLFGLPECVSCNQGVVGSNPGWGKKNFFFFFKFFTLLRFLDFSVTQIFREINFRYFFIFGLMYQLPNDAVRHQTQLCPHCVQLQQVTKYIQIVFICICKIRDIFRIMANGMRLPCTRELGT